MLFLFRFGCFIMHRLKMVDPFFELQLDERTDRNRQQHSEQSADRAARKQGGNDKKRMDGNGIGEKLGVDDIAVYQHDHFKHDKST